jgi:predicted transcriptional regulator
LSGDDITLDTCTFEEVLPYSLLSIPVSTITPNDNIWIATAMLARISDITSNLVVIEDEFPIGTVSALEIISGLQKEPTVSFFDTNVTRIMNVDYYIDSRNVNVSDILKRMERAKNPFTLIQNDNTSFSQFSIRQVLEIGALCKNNIVASSFPKKQIPVYKREDKISDVIEILNKDKNQLALLECENSFVNCEILLEKIKELNTPQSQNLLELSASTFKTITPTLISDRMTLSDMCKIMINSRYPCVMTSELVITPHDVLEVLCEEL